MSILGMPISFYSWYPSSHFTMCCFLDSNIPPYPKIHRSCYRKIIKTPLLTGIFGSYYEGIIEGQSQILSLRLTKISFSLYSPRPSGLRQIYVEWYTSCKILWLAPPRSVEGGGTVQTALGVPLLLPKEAHPSQKVSANIFCSCLQQQLTHQSLVVLGHTSRLFVCWHGSSDDWWLPVCGGLL